MDFSEALKALKEGNRVRRKGKQSYYLATPCEDSFILVRRLTGCQPAATFLTSEELFAQDWEIYTEA